MSLKNLETFLHCFLYYSLFMNIPRPIQVEEMLASSVLTPYYNEEVLCRKEQIWTEYDDGISMMMKGWTFWNGWKKKDLLVNNRLGTGDWGILRFGRPLGVSPWHKPSGTLPRWWCTIIKFLKFFAFLDSAEVYIGWINAVCLDWLFTERSMVLGIWDIHHYIT